MCKRDKMGGQGGGGGYTHPRKETKGTLFVVYLDDGVVSLEAGLLRL